MQEHQGARACDQRGQPEPRGRVRVTDYVHNMVCCEARTPDRYLASLSLSVCRMCAQGDEHERALVALACDPHRDGRVQQLGAGGRRQGAHPRGQTEPRRPRRLRAPVEDRLRRRALQGGHQNVCCVPPRTRASTVCAIPPNRVHLFTRFTC